MVNRERGEREVEIGGKRYTTVMNLDAMAKLEDYWSQQYGKETFFSEIMEKAARGSIKHAHSVLWASMLTYQPDVTLADLAGITFVELQQQVNTLNQSTQPDARDLADAGVKQGKRPQKAQINGAAGTGATLKSKPVSLA